MSLSKGAMLAAEVQVLSNEIARAMGHTEPITTCRLDEVEPFLPPTVKAGAPVVSVGAWRFEFTGDERFTLCAWPSCEPGQDTYDAALMTSEGFQVWPQPFPDVFRFDSVEDVREDAMDEFVMPFLMRAGGMAPGRFEAWLTQCRKDRDTFKATNGAALTEGEGK